MAGSHGVRGSNPLSSTKKPDYSLIRLFFDPGSGYIIKRDRFVAPLLAMTRDMIITRQAQPKQSHEAVIAREVRPKQSHEAVIAREVRPKQSLPILR